MMFIKELAPKPSDAIKAMLAGLIKQNRNPKFRIDMRVFGKFDYDGICYGCAATCAILEIAKVEEIKPKFIDNRIRRAKWLDFDETELIEFEQSIDTFRIGDIEPLFDFYRINLNNIFGWLSYLPSICLANSDWEEQIPVIKEIISLLEEKGL